MVTDLAVVDLAAGAGGWDEGLRRVAPGLHAATLGIDIDPDACATAEKAGHRRLLGDIATINPHDMVRLVGLIGSPPCPTFSKAGKNGGQVGRDLMPHLVAHAAVDCADGWVEPTGLPIFTDDDRAAALSLQPLRWVDACRPAWVALEQVPPIVPLWHAMATTLSRWGYRCTVAVLNAADYGAPQTRRRAFLLARDDLSLPPPPIPTPTHAQVRELGDVRPTVAQSLPLGATAPWRTMADVLPAVGRDWTLRHRRDSATWVEQFGERHNRRTFEPAPTVTGEWPKWAWLTTGDCPAEIPVVAPEAATLQTFPDSYPWTGPARAVAIQIGNAVPPTLSAAVLAALIHGPDDPGTRRDRQHRRGGPGCTAEHQNGDTDAARP